MGQKTIKRKQTASFTIFEYLLISIALIVIGTTFIRLYPLNPMFSLVFFVPGVSILPHALYKSFHKRKKDMNNPLNFFISKSFDLWLVKSGIYKPFDETSIEIPVIKISMQGNKYFLDIQEFYDLGEKQIASSDAINAYAYQHKCDLRVVESFRHDGFIRYVFIKMSQRRKP